MSGQLGQDVIALGAPSTHATTGRAGGRSHWWQRLLRQPWACAGLIIVLVAVFSSLAAPWIAPYDPNAGVGGDKLLPIGAEGHLLGTDDIGRDVLSRLLWGGRTALVVGFVPVAIAVVIAVVLGLIAGYAPDVVSGVIMRIIDILFAFPTVLFAIAFAALYGPGLWPVILTIVLAAIPYLTRVIYTEVRAERSKEYVDAARVLGSSSAGILFREILPNVSAPIIVYATSWAGGMIVFAASLSAVGIGVQPPTADWGRMVADGAKLFSLGAPQLSLLPGLFIILVATGLNWLGDGLRDALDPYHD